jgi:hypothetical protein
VGAAAAPAQGWAEKLFKDGTSHDFGSVPRGAQLYHRFAMTNPYAARLDITDLRTSCSSCTTVTASTRSLEPRQTGYVELLMDARKFTGPKTIKITVTVGPQFVSTAELKVTANARADIVFNPGEANFGVVPRGQTPTQTIDVEYAGTLDWRVSELVKNNAPFDATFKELYRRPGQVGYQVGVTLKPDTPAGELKHELFLKTNDPASPLVPVLVQANLQAPLQVVPETVPLGVVKAGDTVVKRVQVRGTKPFRVTAIDGLGDGVTADLPAGTGLVQTITLKCQPTKAGEFRKQLQIKTDMDKEPPGIVTLEGNVAP